MLFSWACIHIWMFQWVAVSHLHCCLISTLFTSHNARLQSLFGPIFPFPSLFRLRKPQTEPELSLFGNKLRLPRKMSQEAGPGPGPGTGSVSGTSLFKCWIFLFHFNEKKKKEIYLVQREHKNRSALKGSSKTLLKLCRFSAKFFRICLCFFEFAMPCRFPADSLQTLISLMPDRLQLLVLCQRFSAPVCEYNIRYGLSL